METKKKRQIKAFSLILLIIYLMALAYFCFFSETYGRTIIRDTYRYNLEPFKEIIRFLTYRDTVGIWAFLLNFVGNIVVFMPFGFILPVIFVKMRGIFKCVGATLGLSLVIEAIQLVTRVGSFDVDDLILNTLGGLLGYIVFKIFNILRKRRQQSSEL